MSEEKGSNACHSYGKFEAGSGSMWGKRGTKTIEITALVVLVDMSVGGMLTLRKG